MSNLRSDARAWLERARLDAKPESMCPSYVCPVCYHEKDTCSHCDKPEPAEDWHAQQVRPRYKDIGKPAEDATKESPHAKIQRLNAEIARLKAEIARVKESLRVERLVNEQRAEALAEDAPQEQEPDEEERDKGGRA